MISILCELVL